MNVIPTAIMHVKKQRKGKVKAGTGKPKIEFGRFYKPPFKLCPNKEGCKKPFKKYDRYEEIAKQYRLEWNLHDAISKWDFFKTSECIANGADLMKRDYWGNRPVERARNRLEKDKETGEPFDICAAERVIALLNRETARAFELKKQTPLTPEEKTERASTIRIMRRKYTESEVVFAFEKIRKDTSILPQEEHLHLERELTWMRQRQTWGRKNGGNVFEF